MSKSVQHHAIYIPGLGDSRSYSQDNAIKKWAKRGVVGHYFPVGWADKEDWAPKLARLLTKIDKLSAHGHIVSLVGASAGASAVLNAYAHRPAVNAVVCIAGKINNPQSISKRIYQINPAFKQSVYGVFGSLSGLNNTQKTKIMSIHPLFDGTVPVKDTLIDGAVEKSIPVIGHRLGIFYTITLGSSTITNFIKSQSVK